METLSITTYNDVFWLNLFLSTFIFSILSIFILLTVKDGLARAVIIFGFLCYIFPIPILTNWIPAYHRYHAISITALFFLVTIIWYHVFSLFLMKIKPKFLVKRVSGGGLLYPFVEYTHLINVIFYSFSLFFILYFFVYGGSGFFAWLDGASNVRFIIYENPTAILLLYVLFSRVILPITFVWSSDKYFLFTFFIGAFVSIQSIERQAVFMLMLSMAVRYLFVGRKFKDLILFVIACLFVVLVSSIQGNYDTVAVFDVFQNFFKLVLNRIVLDPASMLVGVIEYTDGSYSLFKNNKIIGLLFGGYDSSYSAIGIIADGYYFMSGYIGVIIAAIWFSFLIVFCRYILLFSRPGKLKISLFLLLFTALISFYYSNIFSLVPLFMIFLAFTFVRVGLHLK